MPPFWLLLFKLCIYEKDNFLFLFYDAKKQLIIVKRFKR